VRTAPPAILPVIAIDRSLTKPLYRQIYEGYRDAIVERRLRAGQRLPSSRTLAAELQMSRIPILNAFEQLLAEGYFESRVGRELRGQVSSCELLISRADRLSQRLRPLARIAARRAGLIGGAGLRIEASAFHMGQRSIASLKVWSAVCAACRNKDPASITAGYGFCCARGGANT
jgi:DNA-binding transcriptional MocR family regulator